MRAVIDNTSEIGWGFHDELISLYYEINWLGVDDVDTDKEKLNEIKEYIVARLEKRKDIPDFEQKTSITEVISEIINADEVFLSKMDSQGIGYSNGEEYDSISNKTGYAAEFVELILWHRYCYEMDNDNWQFEGECSKCGNDELYIKEIPNEDFADQVICKKCGERFKREWEDIE